MSDWKDGLVFDLETIGHPDLDLRLRTEAKLMELRALNPDEVRGWAEMRDITVPSNIKDEMKILRRVEDALINARDKAALKPYGNQICAIAVREVRNAAMDAAAIIRGDDDSWPVWDGEVWATEEDRTERDVIVAFLSHLESYGGGVVLMGFNIRGQGGWRKGFDIPVLRTRCILLGIPWPEYLPQTIREDKFSPALFDLCDVFSEGSCDDWLAAAGLPLKSASGAAVANMTPAERREYVANDVELERLLCGLVLPNHKLRDLL
jgi:hypothetical protein